jgi:AcrR family transcriptional regulator
MTHELEQERQDAIRGALKRRNQVIHELEAQVLRHGKRAERLEVMLGEVLDHAAVCDEVHARAVALLGERPTPLPPTLEKALAAVVQERLRQIEVEGYDAAHDDEHQDYSLALAAAAYVQAYITLDAASPKNECGCGYSDRDAAMLKLKAKVPQVWPDSWNSCHWKPKVDPVRNLDVAVALLLAEKERLLRAQQLQDDDVEACS